MLQEWGLSLSHRYIGGYRLEMDQTWTSLDRTADVDQNKEMTRKLLSSTSKLNEVLCRQTDSGNGAELMEST